MKQCNINVTGGLKREAKSLVQRDSSASKSPSNCCDTVRSFSKALNWRIPPSLSVYIKTLRSEKLLHYSVWERRADADADDDEDDDDDVTERSRRGATAC